MLKFLRNLFKTKEIQKQEVKLEALPEWFNTKAEEIRKQVNSELKSIKEKIKENIKKAEEALSTLENAQLSNPKISIREKQFMHGNREAYIKRTKVFLKSINIEEDFNKILESCSLFDSMLNSFGKSTAKSYHILQEFFAHESRTVASHIKNMDILVKSLKSAINEKNFEKIEDIKEKINRVLSNVNIKKQKKEELEKQENNKKGLLSSNDSLKKELEKLKTSEEYNKFEMLKGKREGIESKLKELPYSLIHSFSILENSLKKFARIAIEDEKLINKYIENPLNALLDDKELKITGILSKLEKNILDNSIQLKDKKKNKSLDEIKRLDRDFFNNFLREYDQLDNELKDINEKIKELEIKENIKKLNDSLKGIDFKLDKTEENIKKLKKDIEKDNIDKLKETIEKEINNLLKTNIVIS